ncbi:tetratricopeptide repeat protein [Flavobacterium filum]|uniref:tetratricopeptide repeat protein n=1 Tax=Flavobacterium filum TaxID=370974 RepID=UPI0012EBF301|nr:tetratricopeptide repeat protein [Flavobacterium filum]
MLKRLWRFFHSLTLCAILQRPHRMKRLTIIFSLILFGQTLFGQGKTIQRDVLLFEKGLVLHQLVDEDLDLEEIINSKDSIKVKKELATEIKETILEKALEYYQELIDSFPKSKLLFRTLNNKGFIEIALNNKEGAKRTFQKIIDSKADDKEKGGIGSGIMAEPYANYKNRASKVLADIFIKDSNYTEAIKYLDLTKKYPYRHFCGNEYAADEIYMSELYAKCYIGLNDRQKAIETLLPNLLENGLANNSDLVNLTYQTLLQKYSKDDLKIKFEQAFKNYQIEKVKNKDSEYEKYFITFLDTKIELSSWRLDYLKPEERAKEIDKTYRNSEFYKLLNE